VEGAKVRYFLEEFRFLCSLSVNLKKGESWLFFRNSVGTTMEYYLLQFYVYLFNIQSLLLKQIQIILKVGTNCFKSRLYIICRTLETLRLLV
jgi:hypothetical protein